MEPNQNAKRPRDKFWLVTNATPTSELADICFETSLKSLELQFRWRVEGRALQWICNRLNEDGIRTKRGGTWQVSTVRGMLGNRFYTGRADSMGASSAPSTTQ